MLQSLEFSSFEVLPCEFILYLLKPLVVGVDSLRMFFLLVGHKCIFDHFFYLLDALLVLGGIGVGGDFAGLLIFECILSASLVGLLRLAKLCFLEGRSELLAA